MDLIKNRAEKIRFLVVGGLNTLVDFALLIILTTVGVDKIVANYISTSSAFLFSFALNKNYTFKSKKTNTKKEFILFAAVTLSGLWILQPAIFYLMDFALSTIIADKQVLLVVEKIIATTLTLIWNYVFYSRVVFRRSS